MESLKNIESDLSAQLTQDDISDDAFDHLAARLFKHQYSNNTAYQNYCDASGTSPANITRWQDTPALPTDAFKFPDTPIISFPSQEIKYTFLTSGTTTEQKGEHHFPSLDLYETSILQMWQNLNLGKTHCAFFLTPSPDDAPHSSLSHMMGTLAPVVANQSFWIHTPTGPNIQQLKQQATKNQPVFLFGTALAFLDLFDQLPEPLNLPDGSLAMETGGYKGTHRQLEKNELYSLFGQKLGLPENSIINEYSMTELSSQFYTRGIGNPHSGPPWTRIRVIDPSTGLDTDTGKPGYLRIYDLANLHSVMAIQTQDIAIAHNNRSFTLVGRDPSALPRGCSRTTPTHPPQP